MNRRSAVPIWLALWLVLTGCLLPQGVLLLSPSGPTPTTASPATVTETPFIPVPPTGTLPPSAYYTPTASPTPVDPWEDFPAPVEMSAIEIPRPAEEIRFPTGVMNFVLLGSDARLNQGGYRTDTMMIVSLDPTASTVTMLSIPRDLYVYVPGWRVDRINTAEPRGGFEMLRQTVLYNFGIPLDHWARVNFQGFIAAVDTLGGIDVEVTGYMNDECGGTWYVFRPGTTRHMDGWTAHCYVRMRRSTGDFDRLRRQQEVIRAVFAKIVTLDGLSRVPELYSQFSRMVDTDMTLEDALPYVPLAASVASGSGTLRSFAIDGTMAQGWRVPSSGASVLLPNWEAIRAMLETAFGS
jgi:LCP family protein required for cell wall assembly